jgi:glycosyltransferase involved in cell wall biosynthesis
LLFQQKKNKKEIRKALGIDQDSFVMMFRQDNQEWKGLIYIQDMLSRLHTSFPITLLSVGQTGLMENFRGRYVIKEFPWVNDEKLLADLYASADVFLMPSVAEAFGMMAVEAMLSSLPVIVFYGTALPSTTFSPECGIAINRGDIAAFVHAVEELIHNPKEREIRGMRGRDLALKHYDLDTYHNTMLDLYRDIIVRRGRSREVVASDRYSAV